MGLERI